jgi:starch synthase
MANDAAGADVVHSHMVRNEDVLLNTSWNPTSSLHTAWSLCDPGRQTVGGGYRVSSQIEKSAYESADAVIAVSAGMRLIFFELSHIDPASSCCATVLMLMPGPHSKP